jgi:chorismate mutase/prephenate dehydratase
MTLQELRNKIDGVDEHILRLLNERMELAEHVGALKKTNGQAVFDPAREQALLQSLTKKNKGDLPEAALRAIYREILSASRMKQKRLVIAYLGPEATNTHQAALERFGTSDTYLPCRTIPEIFAAVARDEADAAVVPIENSTEGGVNATHDALVDSDLVICGEIYQPIVHVLMAAKPAGTIRRIFSHPQAFGQCRNWLLQHYPAVDLVEVSSTAYAAQRAQKEPESAAIASDFTARFYGLKIVHSHIQDVAKNLTRFLILGKGTSTVAPARKNKTSLLFAVPHQVGALGVVLKIFSDNKLNLEKIESRPAHRKAFEYLFFVDIKGHCQQASVKSALNAVRQKTLWLKILGSYPQAGTATGD